MSSGTVKRSAGPVLRTMQVAGACFGIAALGAGGFYGVNAVEDAFEGPPPVVSNLQAHWVGDINAKACDATGVQVNCFDAVTPSVTNPTSKPEHITLSFQVATNDSLDNGGSPGFQSRHPVLAPGAPGTTSDSNSALRSDVIDLGMVKGKGTVSTKLVVPSPQDHFGGQFVVSVNGRPAATMGF